MSDVTSIFARLAGNAPALTKTTAVQRAARIDALVKALLGRKEQAFEAGRIEMGLSETDVTGQLIMIKAEADFVMQHLAEWMRPTKVANSIMMLGKKAYIQYEPKGVVLNLATWNAPLAIGLIPAISALAAGNAVLLKPSELAPQSSSLLREIVAASVPDNEFTVIEGGPEIATELLKLPFNHIFFIGGQHVGRIVMRAAAEHFASITLEMGGKSPVFVDDSADITDAARKIAWGRLSNAGQVCIAPDYVLVKQAAEQEFLHALVTEIPRMYNADGRGFEHSPDYPRVINQAHFARVQGLIDDALAKGARAVLGGRSDPGTRFISPTVLTGVTEDMRVMQEEIFGPVLPVMAYSELDLAMAGVRARKKPLALYVYAKNRQVIDAVLAGTSAGSTVINHNMIQSGTNPNLPFGGVNASGIGRIGGRQGFLECSNPRSVVEETSASQGLTPLPPFDAKTRKMMAGMLGRSTLVPAPVISAIQAALRVRAVFR